MTDRRPNILLITSDQQRFDALGFNGNRILRTPNLDALAASGANFSRCYITCPVCIPARRTLISGLHPDTHGMPGYRDGVEFEPVHTLPGLLGSAGYQTQLIGKLHLHPQRKRFGYDHMILSDSSNFRPKSPNQRENDYTDWITQVAPHATSSAHGVNSNGRVARPFHLPEQYHQTSWLAAQACRFFDTWRDPSCPWFLHLSFSAPHPPLTPPQVYWDRYVNRQDLSPRLGQWATRGPSRPGIAPDAARGPFDPEEIRLAIAGYYALINHIDDAVHSVLDRYFEYGNPRGKEPTWIIFSSDHGEMLGDHHLFRKSLPYEASAHVPMFISGRNVPLPKASFDSLCCWEDIMPTVLDLAGVAIPDGLDGRSLVPVMRREKAEVREDLHGGCLDRVPHRYVVRGRLKYIWFTKTNEEQLFDVVEDPHELRDLSGAAELIEPMRALMAPVAQRAGLTYAPSALTPCANQTPRAL